MMKLTNITNAFVRIETGSHVLICDPWISDGIFYGGWSPYPPVRDPDSALGGATHCFISHIHEDHWDRAAIQRLPLNTTFLIPDIYPNHIIRRRLDGYGFRQVRMLAPSTPVEVATGLVLEVVPPMNGWAQETDAYKANRTAPVAIDAGLIVSADDARIVLLADNSPYDVAAAGTSLHRMKGCDLLGIPFNGFADDYPVCYDNFTLEEKRRISRERTAKRMRLQLASVASISPKALMTYSSDILVRGPRAREFVAVHPAEWADRKAAAAQYEAVTGIPAYALYEGDLLFIGDGPIRVERHAPAPPSLADLAEKAYAAAPNSEVMFANIAEADLLYPDFAAAANHMLEKLAALNIRSDWALEFEITDLAEVFSVDLGRKMVSRAAATAEKRVRCRLPSGYLKAHLDFKVHWNNSMISYNLTWSRTPNAYDFGVYEGINFLHKPLVQ